MTEPQPPATEAGVADAGDQAPLVVYWRPGCPFCRRLEKVFERASVTYERRNIWEDDDARRFVAAHNRGAETVPTVALGPLGGEVVTNPDPVELVGRLAEERPDLVGEPDAVGGWRGRLRLF